MILDRHMSQWITRKGEIDGYMADGAKQAEGVRGRNGRIEHRFIATGSAIGRP